ncbi:MAG: hypothetical protein Q7N50_13290 [Armatimonadota bacterium]|nr:hypothetical protein [Armatimonadota bacterium]
MRYTRSILFLTAFAVLLLIPTIVFAQSWSNAATAGLTTVNWFLEENTYTFTLTNNSGFIGDSSPGYDLLVWSLQPFQIPKPTSWTAPDGWEWKSSGGNQAFNAPSNRKYYSPPAVAPGESMVFTYTFDPAAPFVNTNGSQPEGIAFLAHVGAVESAGSENNGITEWTPKEVEGLGASWYDESVVINTNDTTPTVPEPSGTLVLAFGSVWIITCLARSRGRLLTSPSP